MLRRFLRRYRRPALNHPVLARLAGVDGKWVAQRSRIRLRATGQVGYLRPQQRDSEYRSLASTVH